METSLSSEALVRLMNTEFPQQQSAQPELAQGASAPTSQRADPVIDSTTQRESSDSVSSRVDEPRPLRPLEVAQPLSQSLGQRFAALLSLVGGFAAVLAIAGVSLYVLVYLLVPPADEKPAVTTAPTLKAAPIGPESTKTMASATSPERAPESSATNSMPAPVKPPEAAAAAVLPGGFAPGTAPAVPAPDSATPPKEVAPVVAVAPGALAPGTAPAAPMAAPAASPEEAPPIVAVAPGALAPGIAPAVTVPEPAKPPEKLRASTAENLALLARGDSLFGVGDVASARLFYERATDAGDAQAALRLGETFDPAFLARARLNGVRGDLAVATHWYRRARDLGASEAEILLKSVEKIGIGH